MPDQIDAVSDVCGAVHHRDLFVADGLADDGGGVECPIALVDAVLDTFWVDLSGFADTGGWKNDG